jgi:predicted small metal-binding protein
MAMAEKMKEVDCPCGTVVKSHDEKEITEFIILHAWKSHNTILTEEDVKEDMKDAA